MACLWYFLQRLGLGQMQTYPIEFNFVILRILESVVFSSDKTQTKGAAPSLCLHLSKNVMLFFVLGLERTFAQYKDMTWIFPMSRMMFHHHVSSLCLTSLFRRVIINMGSAKGMNSFILHPDVVEEIQEDPLTPAETFEILDGCEDPERSYDIPTGQPFSNGVHLYYTPQEAPQPPAPPRNHKGKGRKRPAEEEVQEPGGHQGLGVLDILPASPQILFTHGGGRDIFQKGFMHFARGMARTHTVLAFRKDRAAGDREERLFKRTAAFNYFFNDAYSSVQAFGGRSFGGRAAARASVYSTNKNLILWSYPLIRDSDWRKDELIALSEDTRVLFIKGDEDWVSFATVHWTASRVINVGYGPQKYSATDMLTSH